MSFSKNDFVSITALKRAGKIVKSFKDDTYEVEVGNLTFRCTATEITLAKKPKSNAVQHKTFNAHVGRIPKENEVLDLHGLNSEIAVQRLEAKIDRSLRAQNHRIKVIHGLGLGILQKAVHSYLSKSPIVENFFIDTKNPGVTWIYL